MFRTSTPWNWATLLRLKSFVTTFPPIVSANFRSLLSTSGISSKSLSLISTSISSSFWIEFSISRPLLPLTLFKSSDESAICCSSFNTNLGITNFPSINPVLHMSAILPSIITLVSKTLGGIFFTIVSFLDCFSLKML